MRDSSAIFTDKPFSSEKSIILAGGTGELGKRIASYLVQYGATVIALVRKGSSAVSINTLRAVGIQIVQVDFANRSQLVQACSGGSCVISALNGLQNVIIDTQTALLDAAVEAGVPRFIPSDYSIDYTKLPFGNNRNLDLRRQFAAIADRAPIKTTSILNGMFTNLLTGQAPVILFGMKRVVYWENAEQLLDFTTIDNTAEYTARVAIDEATPRFLRIAGEVTNANGLKETASKISGDEFRLLKAGQLSRLRTIIKITKTILPQKKEIFPPWQGMQYLHDMFTGMPKLQPLDNNRYTGIHWTTVREILEKEKKG